MGAGQLQLVRLLRGCPARTHRAGVLCRHRCLVAARGSRAGFDLDGADACQKHRGIRVPGPAGSREATRWSMEIDPSHRRRRDPVGTLRHCICFIDNRRRGLDVDVGLRDASPFCLYGDANASRGG